MNRTLNKVTLIGYLGDDVKLHYFEKGSCNAYFSIATNETYLNKNSNEVVSNTEWHNIVTRNKTAELCEQYLSKGDRVYIEGKIRSRSKTSKDGSTKTEYEILASEVIFLSQKKTKNNDRETQSELERQIEKFEIPKTNESDNSDEKLPF